MRRWGAWLAWTTTLGACSGGAMDGVCAAETPGQAADGSGVPEVFRGVVTQEEFFRYLDFQDQLETSAAIRVLEDRELQLVRELAEVRAERERVREALLGRHGVADVERRLHAALRRQRDKRAGGDRAP